MPFLSVEVESRRVRAVLLEKEGGTLTILKEAVMAVPATEDPKVAGMKFLREFVKKNKIATRKIYLTISNPDMIIIKNTLLPSMPSKEIVPAITWIAREESSLNGDCQLFNYEVVKEYAGDDTAQKLVVVYAIVNRKELDLCLTSLARAGFETVQVSAEPFDYAKILSCYGDGAVSQAILDVGYEHSTLAIYRHGKMIFIRTLGFSFAKVKAALNDPLFLGEMHRSPEADGEIEKAIRLFGIPTDSVPAGEGNTRGSQFFALMRPLGEGLVREIRYSLTYFMTNFKEEKPATLFLTGHAAEFKGLETFFAKELGMSTFNLLLPPKIRNKSEGAVTDPIVLSQCIGAVAGVFAGKEVVDFTPLDFKNLKLESLQRKFLMFASLILAGILATSLFFMNMQRGFLEDRFNLGKRQLLALGKVADFSLTAFPRYYLASEIDRATIPADKVLRLVAYLLPKEVVLKHFVLDSSRRRLDLEVAVMLSEAEKQDAVQGFVRRLKETSFFSTIGMRSQGEFYRIEGEFRHD